MTQTTVEGVLPVLKPAGLTSHDVVAKVRRMLRIKRIGHTGTLDPDVSGVLPLCIGRATRVVEYIQELPKQYEAVLHIGEASTTEDSSGEITARVDQVEATEDRILEMIQSFIGEIEQIPPMYSAVKHEGQRLYDLARQGIEVERRARKATIYAIDVSGMEWKEGHPFVRFHVTCSKGTYIRTLCTDIGQTLGYPALMHSLIRTASGPITLDRCLTLEQIQAKLDDHTLQSAMIPVDVAIAHFPAVELGGDWTAKARNGLKLPSTSGTWPDTNGLVRLYAQDGSFIGVYQRKAESGAWAPIKLFH